MEEELVLTWGKRKKGPVMGRFPGDGVPGLNLKSEVEWSYKLQQFRDILVRLLVRENHWKLSK